MAIREILWPDDGQGETTIQSMEKKVKTQRIPGTDSIEELARFWDTHDLTDFEAELTEVSKPVFEPETSVRIHLPPQDAEAIERIAKAKGVAPRELIREWILQKVHTS